MELLPMKIAILNSWPNLTFSAEREFIARFRLACERMGWLAIEVVTSDDVMLAAPDVVLVTHEFSPKLTKYPTLGVIWSPTAFFAPDPDRIRNILSYDGYLVATQSLREYIEHLLRTHGKKAPISYFDFLPSALSTPPPKIKRGAKPASLFYAGVHWDGNRHGDLFAALQGRVPMKVYGDSQRWQNLGSNFAGPLPFDGKAVIEAIQSCGVALALQGSAHRAEGIPSARLFEAAAAGAIIISDRVDFATREFGDALLYIDADADAAAVSGQIVDHMSWIQKNPTKAKELATRSHKIFNTHFTLEKIFSHLPEFCDEVRRQMGLSEPNLEESVDIIVRVGSRPLALVARAIASIADQSHRRIGLIVVCFRPIDGLSEMLCQYEDRFISIKIVEVTDNGLRSTALWAGLQSASATFVANLDDDDIIHPNHISSLLQTFQEQDAQASFVYSGTIQVQEEDGHYYNQANFRGDAEQTIKERRQLRFLEVFDHKRLWFDNFIQSNAWMVRRSALTAKILKDPELIVAEDVYFYNILSLQGRFISTWRPTAEWNWRSTTRDNVMFLPHLWEQASKQLYRQATRAGVTVASQSTEKVSRLNIAFTLVRDRGKAFLRRFSRFQ